MRVAQRASVRHVEAPQADAVDGDPDGARFDRLVGAFGTLQETGLTFELGGDIRHRKPRGEGDAVPLVEARQLHVVTGGGELLVRKLLGLALDLLHREHVDVFTHHPVDGAVDTGSDRVHIPGGYAHAPTLPFDRGREAQ